MLNDVAVFVSEQQDTIRSLQGSPGSSNLLIVVDDRLSTLKMHHESEIRFVEAHSQRGSCHESLDLILEKRLLAGLAISVVSPAMVR